MMITKYNTTFQLKLNKDKKQTHGYWDLKDGGCRCYQRDMAQYSSKPQTRTLQIMLDTVHFLEYT
jgi:hypothetical protein